jgi:hypothetical protein
VGPEERDGLKGVVAFPSPPLGVEAEREGRRLTGDGDAFSVSRKLCRG